jgi:glycosyltransferase involved in cell wall biosynthesis
MRKRLLFIVNVDWFFVSHRLPIALAAKRLGYEVHLAAAFDADTRARLESLGITTHPMRFSRSGSNPFELLRDLRNIRRLLEQFRDGIAHLVTLKPVLLGGIAARLVGVPRVVLAIPGRGTVFSAHGWVAAIRRCAALLAYRLAYAPQRTKVIVQNVEDFDYFVLRRIFERQDVRLIRGSGADIEHFKVQAEPAGPLSVVFASRLLREKGVSDFVAAATLLKRRHASVRFVIVGDPDPGNPHSHTSQELEAWVAQGSVEWWGFRADMDNVFAGAHLVCLPSYYGEGVPKVLIEAAACGRAIVTTDMPGCRDIVKHGGNGLLVPARDPAALAEAIQTLLTDPELRAEMGRRGRALVEAEFSTDTVSRQTLAIYEELLK